MAVLISGLNVRVDSYTSLELVTAEIAILRLGDMGPRGPIQVTFTRPIFTVVSTELRFSITLQLRVVLVPIYEGVSVVTSTIGDGTVKWQKRRLLFYHLCSKLIVQFISRKSGL